MLAVESQSAPDVAANDPVVLHAVTPPALPLLFVFGTLKAGFGNHVVMQRAGGELVGTATLPGYEMFSFGGFPGIRPKQGAVVHGELYTVKSLRPLDSLEGCHERKEDSFFWRTDVQVVLKSVVTDGGGLYSIARSETVACQTYVPQGDYSDLQPVPDGVWK